MQRMVGSLRVFQVGSGSGLVPLRGRIGVSAHTTANAHRWAGRIKAIAIKEREMSIYVRVMFALFVLSLNSACATVFGKHLDITVDEVPVYPNAQNVVRENQGPEGFEEYIYTWSFTTSDTPDDVWQFYADEMGREWGFYDVSSPQSDDYSLIVKSCPFYYVDMTNTVDDDGSYNIIITFGKELCR
jgi:hypothetical protein